MRNIKFDVPESFYLEEIRNGYKISSDMKRVWAKQLELLNEVMRICEQYKLKYFAIGGTLLGAVRHKGYIPWDDDLDIAMPRNDYNKFCQIAPKELGKDFFFQTEKTDPGYLLRHAKVRNSKTTGILKNQKDKNFKFNQGIFMDIFPLDKLPDDEEERNTYYKDLYKSWGKVYGLSSFFYRGEEPFDGDEKILEQMPAQIEMFNEEYEELASKYLNSDSQEEGILAVTIQSNKIISNCIWNCKDFKEIMYVPFEFLSIPIPKEFNNILTKQYGNWGEFVIAESLHGDVLFDVNHSYKYYLK